MSSAENLISTLLEISKLDAGALRAEPKPFALTELFDQLSQEFQLIADQRNIAFKAKSRDAVVHTDPKLLRRVLQNFLSNALRYTEPHGRVLFAMRTFGASVRVEIWDTGIGMHPDDLPSIFDEFKRLSEGIQTEKKGLGLGLSISQRICDLLGLTLKVHSHTWRWIMFFGDIADFRVTTRITQPTTSVSQSNAISATDRSDCYRDR